MSVLSIPVPRPHETSAGFAVASPSAGAAHRAALGRGLVFVLVLAATSMAAVCAPVVCEGPRWVDGTAAPDR